MFEYKLRFTIKCPIIWSLPTWVTISRAGQGLVDSASMVLSLDSCIGYKLIPHLEVGRGSDSRWTPCIPLRSDVVV
jgi:hypothetical protein